MSSVVRGETALEYNLCPKDNPLRLLTAFELYENDIYRNLVMDPKLWTEIFLFLDGGRH